MQPKLLPALSWFGGVFAFLAAVFSFPQGFGGIIASIFFVVSALAIFPPTAGWLKSQVDKIYRRPIKDSTFITTALILLTVGILASPIERAKVSETPAFAGQDPAQITQEEVGKQSEIETETVPLINELFHQISSIFRSQ